MDTPDKLSKLSISNDARAMLVRAREEGIETVWIASRRNNPSAAIARWA